VNKNTSQENPFINLAFNIALPVLILQKLSTKLGASNALVLALCFPLGFGIYDYVRNHNKNWISLLGVVNTLFTGGFALMHLNGQWFAVKEATFPFLLGIAVWISALIKKPIMKKLFFTPSIFNVDLVEQKAAELNQKTKLDNLFVTSTYLLTLSFMLSSFLNFALASVVFSEIPSELTPDQQTTLLNDQIAQMTWMSFLVIGLPLMLFMGFIFWHLVSNLKKMTLLKTEEILLVK